MIINFIQKQEYIKLRITFEYNLKLKNMTKTREFFVWRESYPDSHNFKTQEMAQQYAEKMNFKNYEIRVVYNFKN